MITFDKCSEIWQNSPLDTNFVLRDDIRNVPFKQCWARLGGMEPEALRVYSIIMMRLQKKASKLAWSLLKTRFGNRDTQAQSEGQAEWEQASQDSGHICCVKQAISCVSSATSGELIVGDAERDETEVFILLKGLREGSFGQRLRLHGTCNDNDADGRIQTADMLNEFHHRLAAVYYRIN